MSKPSGRIQDRYDERKNGTESKYQLRRIPWHHYHPKRRGEIANRPPAGSTIAGIEQHCPRPAAEPYASAPRGVHVIHNELVYESYDKSALIDLYTYYWHGYRAYATHHIRYYRRRMLVPGA